MNLTLAFTPSEAKEAARKKKTFTLEEILWRINLHMENRYRADPHRPSVTFGFPEGLVPGCKQVVQAIVTYREKGWIVELNTGSVREPPSLKFTPSET